MLSGKFVSLKTILEKVFRDYQGTINPDDLYVEEALEWTGEALGLLGINAVYEDVIEEIEVEDYSCDIPTGLVQINFIRSVDSYVPIYKSTDLMYNSENSKFFGDSYTYKENNGHYLFNFEEDTVEISYKKYITDTYGPMIPDDDTFRCYVAEFIACKVVKRLWRIGKIPDKIRIDCEQELSFYAKRAHMRGITPDLASMQNFVNMSLRLLPNINCFDTAFGSLRMQGQRPTPNVR